MIGLIIVVTSKVKTMKLDRFNRKQLSTRAAFFFFNFYHDFTEKALFTFLDRASVSEKFLMSYEVQINRASDI
jgi:hypothetical protein